MVDREDPKTLTESIGAIPTHIKLLLKSLSALLFFILGFNLSRSAFFEEYPLFNIQYLAEFLVSFLSALIGFSIIPRMILTVAFWTESTLYRIVNDIIANFWDQQSRRLQDARRVKELKKIEESEEKIKHEFSHGIVLDTSVLIDGRITDIAKTGFLENVFIVPQFVLDELHLVSDSKDDLKRQKGRRGLDILKQLKKNAKIFIPDNKDGNDGVDKKLVRFCKENKFRLMTMDFNLNKVASVAGVRVLNINDLSNSVKTILIPGEVLVVKIIHSGKEREQGVGYLDDGTMIVVEKTKDKLNQEVTAKVSKLIQSSAGKIIFCDLVA